MQYFTISDIAQLTGVKAHTWRIWEQRYDKFKPQRKESKHRIYDNSDLQRLLRVTFLYNSGWKISQIAALNDPEILQEVRKVAIDPKNYSLFITQLIEASMQFDEDQFTGLLNDLTQKIGFEKCIAEVCYPFLERIGLLWMTNNIIPAQEHFSSYIIQNRIIAATDELPSHTASPAMVLFSPKGEHHELPLLFLHYLLKKNGWNIIYIGANVQFDTLKQFTEQPSVHYLYLHIITNLTGFLLDDFFETLCHTFRDKKIIASGVCVTTMQRQFTNLKLLKSDAAIYNFVKQPPTGTTHKL